MKTLGSLDMVVENPEFDVDMGELDGRAAVGRAVETELFAHTECILGWFE